jgi:IS6 family transposase
MLLAPSISGLFKWRQFEPEVILVAVGWCLRFSLSYRDVEELLAERGLHADHVTVWRCSGGELPTPTGAVPQ